MIIFPRNSGNMDSSLEKIRTVLALVVVFILVFTTNRLDKRHFEEVQKSIVAIHEDRVVAQDYLFDMSKYFYEKRLNVADEGYMKFDDAELVGLMEKYETTRLTKKEEEVYNRMKGNIDELKNLGSIADGPDNDRGARTLLNRIDENLAELSDIQVRESKSLKLRAQESLESNLLISNMEIVLVLIIGIILQIAVFYGGKKRKKRKA
jgi:hypothetical protein